MTDTIKFNVGGKVFEVAQDTIRQSGENFLSAMLARWVQEPDKAQFIDRDPEWFPFMLEWLRDKHVILPFDSSKAAILKEAQFFSLPISEDDIEIDYSQVGHIRKRISDLEDSIDKDLQAKSNGNLQVAVGQALARVAIAQMKGKASVRISVETSGIPEWAKSPSVGWNGITKTTINEELNRAGYISDSGYKQPIGGKPVFEIRVLGK